MIFLLFIFSSSTKFWEEMFLMDLTQVYIYIFQISRFQHALKWFNFLHQPLPISYCRMQRQGSICWTDLDPYSIQTSILLTHWVALSGINWQSIDLSFWQLHIEGGPAFIDKYSVLLFLIGCFTRCICHKRHCFMRQIFSSDLRWFSYIKCSKKDEICWKKIQFSRVWCCSCTRLS